MLSRNWSEEGDLTYLTKNVKRLDKVSLYQVIMFLQEKGFQLLFYCRNELEFSPSFVDNIEIDHQKKIATIILNFSNFFSYSPVIHDHIAEKLIHEKNRSFLLFLNIFYNRIFQILFENRKLSYTYFSIHLNMRIFSSLSGLTEKKDFDYLEYNSYFICKHRSKKILEKLLNQFTGIVVRIQEFFGDFFQFEEEYQMKLNTQSQLNGYFSLGKKHWTSGSKIKIIFYPKSTEDWGFFNDKNKSQIILNLINRFINNYLSYNIVIFPNKIVQSKLKKTNKIDFKLGLNTFLCLNEKINETAFFKFYNR